MTKKNTNKEEIRTDVTEQNFTYDKQQILASSKWTDFKDALTVILSDSERYSTDDVENILKKFMERKIR